MPVRGDDHRGAVGGRILEQVGDDRGVLLIHGRERFVGEKHARSRRQGTRDSDALPLSG